MALSHCEEWQPEAGRLWSPSLALKTGRFQENHLGQWWQPGDTRSDHIKGNSERSPFGCGTKAKQQRWTIFLLPPLTVFIWAATRRCCPLVACVSPYELRQSEQFFRRDKSLRWFNLRQINMKTNNHRGSITGVYVSSDSGYIDLRCSRVDSILSIVMDYFLQSTWWWYEV